MTSDVGKDLLENFSEVHPMELFFLFPSQMRGIFNNTVAITI